MPSSNILGEFMKLREFLEEIKKVYGIFRRG